MDEAEPKRKRAARKRSPRPTKTGWHSADTSNAQKKLWAKPEYRERILAAQAAGRAKRMANPTLHGRLGVPDGMRKEEADAQWAKARDLGKKFMAILEDAEAFERAPIPGSEEEMGKKALEEAFVMAIGPLSHQTKTANIRTVLEWTKAKPESKSKLTLSTAEQWLADVAADMKAKSEPAGEDGAS